MLTAPNIPQPRLCKGVLPESAANCLRLLENGRYRFTFSKAERQALRKRKKEQPSKWAPKNVKIPTGPFECNYVNLDLTPHLAGMIDAYALSFVRKLTICAAPQTTKTTAALICKAWSSVFDPGPTLSIYPTEVTGTEIMQERVQPAYKQSPQLRRQMWDDEARNQAARRGVWRLQTEDGSPGEEMFRHLNRTRAQSIGFIVPSWISYFVSLFEVAAACLKTRDKNLSPEERFMAYKDFQNVHRSRPWKFELQTQAVDKIRIFCDDRPAGRLPGGERVASLLFGIDTQDDCFYLSIWAFGYGFQTSSGWSCGRRSTPSNPWPRCCGSLSITTPTARPTMSSGA